MTKLTLEQREQLSDMYESGEWNTVLALCQVAVERYQSLLITCDISKGDRDLLLNKARLEGAQDVKRLLDNVREHIGGAKRKSNG